MTSKSKEDGQEQLQTTPKPQAKLKIYWIKIESDMSKGKDNSSSGKDSINMSIVMRTRWKKVASPMIRSLSRKIRRVIDLVTRRIPITNTITPASKPLTQQAAAKKPHPVNNSNAPRSK